MMQATISQLFKTVAAALTRLAQMVDPPTPKNRVAEQTDASRQVFIVAAPDQDGSVTDIAETPKKMKLSSPASVDMNVDEAARTEWAEMFVDWMLWRGTDGLLTGDEIKALASDFNLWARVKGPPIGPYMFRILRRAGVTSTEPLRDPAVRHRRFRRRLYSLPANECFVPGALSLAA